jgi:hypothetical protein
VDKNKILSSYSYASIADVIFCGLFIKSQVSDLKLKKSIQRHSLHSDYTFIRQKQFQLKENDIIFCKTEHIYELFYLLNKKCNFENIKLITHQSDMKITKKIYKLKPKCISKWYAINVDFKNDDLIPIPIGIANFHSKNLDENNFDEKINFNKVFEDKKNLLYLNFNQNTNFNHRKGLFDQFSNETIRRESINNEDYYEELQNHNFILAPWGNGIDTHRFWEAVYGGSIPITKQSPNFNRYCTFPYILVPNYKEINPDFLKREFKKLQNNKNDYNFSELDIDYWESYMKNSTNNKPKNSVKIVHDKYLYYQKKERMKHIIKSKLKMFNRLRRAVYRLIKI